VVVDQQEGQDQQELKEQRVHHQQVLRELKGRVEDKVLREPKVVVEHQEDLDQQEPKVRLVLW
jgi:hypothetical protein